MLTKYLKYLQESKYDQRLDLTNIKRVQYLDKMIALNIPKNSCIIISSGVMALYGLRDIMHDLDLVAPKDIYKKLSNDKRFKERTNTDGANYLTAYGDIIEVWSNLYELQMTVRELLRQSIIVDGFRFGTLKLTYLMKKKMNRPKDRKDIKIIVRFCKKNKIKL